MKHSCLKYGSGARMTIVLALVMGASAPQAGLSGRQQPFTPSQPGTPSTFIQDAYLKASNTGSSDFFGLAMAMAGDTVVVGAYVEDSNAIGIDGDGNDNSAVGSGAVYVFVRNGAAWTHQAYLKA